MTYHSEKLRQIAGALGGARATANGFDCRCPVHDDKRASLSLSLNEDGDILAHCHVGCEQGAVFNALRERGLLEGRPCTHPRDDKEKIWKISTVNGALTFDHVRIDKPEGKVVFWRPKPSDSGVKIRDLELYGSSLVRDEDREVVICEGEKATDAAQRLGLVALGTVTGASSLPCDPAFVPLLRDKIVTLWPDNDEPGRSHMYRIGQRLTHFNIKWRAVKWPEAPPAGDTADFVEAGGTIEQFRAFPLAELEKPERKSKQKKERAPITAFELTDLGNAERLVEQHGEMCRFVPEWGWTVWDGKRWARDAGSLKVRKLAAKTARGIRDEAVGIRDKDQFARVAAHAARSESAPKIAAMLTLAEPKLSASVADFDRHPYLLNCENGTLDLSSGQLRPHRQEDLLTQLSPHKFNPEADAPTWRAFMDDILPDAAVQAFVWTAAGYSMTGDIGEQVLFFLHGGGANGKSTFVEALAHVFGEYAKAAPPGLLLASRHEGHPCELVALQAARFVSSQETAENRSLDEERVKLLTGSDRITARHMHREFFTFEPSHKLWLCSNHRPRIRGTDYAIWRRIRLIPFTIQIPEAKRDPELLFKLKAKAEAEGILAWAVRGALQWQKDRLKAPAAVMAAVEEYRTSEDIVGQWLDERTVSTRSGSVPSRMLYTDFRNWCEQQGERSILSQKMLSSKLKDRGFINERNMSERSWAGLALVDGGYNSQPNLPGA